MPFPLFGIVALITAGVTVSASAVSIAADAATTAAAAQSLAADAAATAAAAQATAAHAASISASAAATAASAESLAASFAIIALCTQVIAGVAVIVGIVYVAPKIRNALRRGTSLGFHSFHPGLIFSIEMESLKVEFYEPSYSYVDFGSKKLPFTSYPCFL